MDNREAIARIERHMKIHFRAEYPFAIYITEALNMAIEALKAQEPRVLTLDEIRSLPKGTDVWIEESGGAIRVDTTDKALDDRWFATVLNLYMLADYGIAWRAWTARPTNEQREATPWPI